MRKLLIITTIISLPLSTIFAQTTPVPSPRMVLPHAPDNSSVVTGGTAINAFTAGHVQRGGSIFNPTTATENLCVDFVNPAGITSNGSTICVPPGQEVPIPPNNNAVSVNAATSGHTFSGIGYYNGTVVVNGGGGNQGTVPATPSAPTVVAGNNQNTITLSTVSGATSYNLKRGTAPGAEANTPIATNISGTTYVDSTAVNGTTYYYTEAAVNTTGASAYSTEANATPVAPTPVGLQNLLYSFDASEPVTTNALTPGVAGIQVDGNNNVVSVNDATSFVSTFHGGQSAFIPNGGPNNFPFFLNNTTNPGNGYDSLDLPSNYGAPILSPTVQAWYAIFVMQQTSPIGANLIKYQSSGGNFNVTSAGGASDGTMFIGQDNSAANGNETTGALTALNQWQIVSIICDGTRYYIFRNGQPTLVTPQGVVGGLNNVTQFEFLNQTNANVSLIEIGNGAPSIAQHNYELSRLSTKYGITVNNVTTGPASQINPIPVNQSAPNTTTAPVVATYNGRNYYWDNQLGSTVSGSGTSQLTFNSPTVATTKVHALMTPLTGTGTYDFHMNSPTAFANYMNYGVAVGTTNQPALGSMINLPSLNLLILTSFPTPNNNDVGFGNITYPNAGQNVDVWYRVVWDGTNYTFLVSLTGAASSFTQVGQQTATTLGNPDQIGMINDTNLNSGTTPAISTVLLKGMTFNTGVNPQAASSS